MICTITAALLVSFALPSQTPGQQLQPDIEIKSVNTETGILETEVYDISQDESGFIWLATRRGLLRFDGYEIRSYRRLPGQHSTLSSNVIITFCILSPDTILLAPETGGLDILDLRNSHVQHYSLRDPQNPERGTMSATRFAALEKGVLLVTSEGNLFYLHGDGSAPPVGPLLTDVIVNDLLPLPGKGVAVSVRDTVRRLKVTEAGTETEIEIIDDLARTHPLTTQNLIEWTLASGAQAGELLLNTSRAARIAAFQRDTARDALLQAAFVDSRGWLWAAFSDGVFIQAEAGGIATGYPVHAPGRQAAGTVNRIIEDSTGSVWLATSTGLFRYSPHQTVLKGRTFLNEQGRTIREILSLNSDSRGALWAGTKEGLYTFPARPGAEAGVRGQRISDVVAISLLEHDETMLAGTEQQGIVQIDLDNGSSSTLLQVNQVTSMVVIEDKLYFGTLLSGLGVHSLSRQTTEFFRLSVPGSSSPEVSFDVRTLLADSDNTVHIGTDGDGIFSLTGPAMNAGQVPPWLQLSDMRVYCLAVVDNILWAGTAEGLNRINSSKGEVIQIFEGGLLPDNTICSIEVDYLRRLWVSTYYGLARIDNNLNSAHTFTRAEGLLNSGYTPGVSTRSADGTLYFGGPGGIDEISPAEMQRSREKPAVALTDIHIAEGDTRRRVFYEPGQKLFIPYGSKELTVTMAVMDFHNPRRNQFMYRLEGRDPEWVDIAARRYIQFANLPPGSYRLLVKGSNNAGIWSDALALPVEVETPFWLTWQFRAAVGAALIMVVIALFHLRVQSVRRRQAELMKEVEERKIAELKMLSQQSRLRDLARELTLSEERQRRKLAHTIHDDIGHVLLGLRVNLKAAMKRSNEPQLQEDLKGISDNLQDALTTARSLTTQLSPPSLYRFGLVSALENLVERFGNRYNIRTSVIRLPRGNIQLDHSILLYQSVRELLMNTLKHAEAASVTVSAGREDEWYIVRYTDDGKGFDYDDTEQGGLGGFGLFSIGMRLKSIGGNLEIQSSPGAGTRITMQAPLSDEEHDKQ